MGSTTKRLVAELQYASREIFSSALRKLDRDERLEIRQNTESLYRTLVKTNSQINKTDILQLLAAIGAADALSDPDFAGSS